MHIAQKHCKAPGGVQLIGAVSSERVTDMHVLVPLGKTVSSQMHKFEYLQLTASDVQGTNDQRDIERAYNASMYRFIRKSVVGMVSLRLQMTLRSI